MMSDYARQVADNVEKHGFHVTYVASDETPPFCYSTGIYRTFGLPELFISSLPPNLSHELIGQYIRRHAEGPVLDQRISAIDERFDYYLIEVPLDRLTEYVLASIQFYGDEAFRYLQLVYPDTELRFPHESGYDYDQEVLGDFAPEDRSG